MRQVISINAISCSLTCSKAIMREQLDDGPDIQYDGARNVLKSVGGWVEHINQDVWHAQFYTLNDLLTFRQSVTIAAQSS